MNIKCKNTPDIEQEFLKIVGNRIKAIRILRNMTIEEFSKKTKIKLEYLKKIEEGNAKRIKFSQFIQICEVLNIKPQELLYNI